MPALIYHHSTWETEARESPETRNGRPGCATQSGAISISRWNRKHSDIPSSGRRHHGAPETKGGQGSSERAVAKVKNKEAGAG